MEYNEEQEFVIIDVNKSSARLKIIRVCLALKIYK